MIITLKGTDATSEKAKENTNPEEDETRKIIEKYLHT